MDAPKRRDGDASTWDLRRVESRALPQAARVVPLHVRRVTRAFVRGTNYLLGIRGAKEEGRSTTLGSRAAPVAQMVSRGRDWCCGRSAPRRGTRDVSRHSEPAESSGGRCGAWLSIANGSGRWPDPAMTP